MALDPTDRRPKFQQIADAWRREILAGHVARDDEPVLELDRLALLRGDERDELVGDMDRVDAGGQGDAPGAEVDPKESGGGRGLDAYQALKLRIFDEVRDRHRDNPFSSLIRLVAA